MLEHNDDGAVGLVLNRPGRQAPPDSLAPWGALMNPPQVVFSGGPVERDTLIALARLNGPVEGAWSPVVGGLGSIDLTLDPLSVAERIDEFRVFRGYSGWGPQQLDGELRAGAWMILPLEQGDVFTGHPEELWREVLRRQGGRIAWLATAPADLSAN
jgi:putative transcriptional regulator